MRDRAVRGSRLSATHVFYRPEVHKAVVNHLYLTLFLSPHPESEIAREFFAIYRHLLEGRSADSVPSKLLDPKTLSAQIKAILRGEAVTLREEQTNDHDRDDREEGPQEDRPRRADADEA